MADWLIQFDGVSKWFGGVRALDHVRLSIQRGHCHGLIGENGAGKSTLGKLLAGIHRPDAGRLLLEGKPVDIASPRAAAGLGIGMVHQELAFCPDLSIAENLCMGRYPRRLGLLLSRRQMRLRARMLLERVGASLNVDLPMRRLSTAQEQLVQIAAAVGTGARILIFDEPTSSLTQHEAQRLFALIRDLRQRGVTMVYVSHRLAEVLDLCDRITVLRDGAHVGTVDRAQADEGQLVRMMIGRSLEQYFPPAAAGLTGEVALRVEGLTSPGKCQDISFDLGAGEIVGFAGLVGSGRSEVARAVFGLDSKARGRIEVGGQVLPMGSVRRAMQGGLGLVPEDRKRQGLILHLSGRENYSLAMLERFRRLGLLSTRLERQATQRQFAQLDVRAASAELPVMALSGGNQQKVVLARWLGMAEPRTTKASGNGASLKVLIVDEPTRGVDVGAKAAIHRLLDELAQAGMAILLISSELPEVLALSSRILVMRQGRLVGQLQRHEATEEKVLRLMAGMA
jgi:ABC-type sugar transport system ATPase subunit